MTTGPSNVCSQHARLRMCQRSISKEELELVLRHGESVRDVGDGCLEVSISRRQWAELRLSGLSASRLDSLKRIVVVIASDGTIVTAMKELRFAHFSRGPMHLTCRDRAMKAARRKRGYLRRMEGYR